MASRKTSNNMRAIHRYLGFFLAGIMAMYSISGIVMIFRNSDTFKVEHQLEKQYEPTIDIAEIGRDLRIRGFKVEKEEGDLVYFQTGTFNKSTGLAKYTQIELPYVLDQMTHLHKATTDSPVYWLNILFGLSLLFFVISSFWMFMPSTPVFKKGLYFTLGGIILTLLLLFV